eukprot:XP_020399931.1 uncharacterized protein LOC109942393 [Zea mays]
MASPSSVNNVNYDPKTDKARKASSNDPGWKYGYWANLANRDQVTCTLCDTIVSGGIKRLKQHLAGGYGDTKICSKTTTAIRKEMRDYLESKRRKRAIFLDDNEQQEEEEDVMVVDAAAESVQVQQDEPIESQGSKVQPSSGTAAKHRRATYLYKDTTSIKTKANQASKQKSIMEMLQKSPKDVVDERRKGCSQPTIASKMKSKEEMNYVDMQWALWFYECGYKPPSPYQLGQPLLKDAVKLTSTMREEHERAWKHYGCTLMSDGWSDRRGRHLINFLVNSPEGTYFLESVDASSEVHDAFMLADLLGKKIEEIGKEKVVQVITDNGANYKATGRILMERFPSLFWSPCAAHCLDLMLEDIGNLKEFKKPIPQGARGCDCGEDENGLTWELVDQAVGASSSLRGRNLPRNANKRARVSHSRFDFEEDFGSANEEEEDQDPHDDVDVTDSEDAHDDVGGENTEAAPDEFEDGY